MISVVKWHLCHPPFEVTHPPGDFIEIKNCIKQWRGLIKLTMGFSIFHLRGEWPSGLYSLRQVTEVKLGRVRSDFGWVTTEA